MGSEGRGSPSAIVSPEALAAAVAAFGRRGRLETRLHRALAAAMAAAPGPVGHGLAEEGRATVDVAEGWRLGGGAYAADPEGAWGAWHAWLVRNAHTLLDSAEQIDATIAERDALKAEREGLRRRDEFTVRLSLPPPGMTYLLRPAREAMFAESVSVTTNEPLLQDKLATLQSSHDLALAEAERLREAVTGAVNELSAMGHSCGNSMRALSALRAALARQEPDHAR